MLDTILTVGLIFLVSLFIVYYFLSNDNKKKLRKKVKEKRPIIEFG